MTTDDNELDSTPSKKYISFYERQPKGLVRDLEEAWRVGGRACFCYLMAAQNMYLLRREFLEAAELEFLLTLHWIRTTIEVRGGRI
jgi:hypothetical protein